MKNSSNELEKKSIKRLQVENHAKLLKSIFKIKNSMVFYTDEVKNEDTTKVAIVLFFNVKTETKSRNLDKYIDVIDTELFAIEKTIEYCAKNVHFFKITLNI